MSSVSLVGTKMYPHGMLIYRFNFAVFTKMVTFYSESMMHFAETRAGKHANVLTGERALIGILLYKQFFGQLLGLAQKFRKVSYGHFSGNFEN